MDSNPNTPTKISNGHYSYRGITISKIGNEWSFKNRTYFAGLMRNQRGNFTHSSMKKCCAHVDSLFERGWSVERYTAVSPDASLFDSKGTK